MTLLEAAARTDHVRIRTSILPDPIPARFQPIISLVKDGLTSEHSKRAYGKALVDFLTWYAAQGQQSLTKAIVQRYKTILQESCLAPSSINQKMSAIRRFAQEAADNGLIEDGIANGIALVRGVKLQGCRSGRWLTRDEAQELLSIPDPANLKGKRDRAILAVMIGAGLRRSEVAGLTFEDIAQREGRWVISDLVGKGNRVRTVPISSWVQAAIDGWGEAAGVNSGRVFRAVHKGGTLAGASLSSQAISDVVKVHSSQMGLNLAAHDLRRTYAKLAHKGGSGLEQIQLSLGHASIKTTELYLGIRQDLTDAPCDHLGLRLD